MSRRSFAFGSTSGKGDARLGLYVSEGSEGVTGLGADLETGG
jgi:hypothetical protein